MYLSKFIKLYTGNFCTLSDCTLKICAFHCYIKYIPPKPCSLYYLVCLPQEVLVVIQNNCSLTIYHCSNTDFEVSVYLCSQGFFNMYGSFFQNELPNSCLTFFFLQQCLVIYKLIEKDYM